MLTRRSFLALGGLTALGLAAGRPPGRGKRKPTARRAGDSLRITEMVKLTRTYQAGSPPDLTYPPDTSLTYVAINADARPGYLADPGLTDSTWATEIRRITNVHERTPDYPRHQLWSRSGHRIFLQTVGAGSGGFRFLDGVTYADLGSHASGVDYPMWSNVDEDVMWGANVPNLFRKFSVASDSWTTIRTFAGYDSMTNGGYEGNISDDDTLTALQARETATGNWYIIVYNPVTDAIVSTRNIGGGGANNCSVSRSGTFVIVAHGVDGTGTNQGTWLYRASDMSPRYQITTNRPHHDPGRDASGDDIVVFVAADFATTRSMRLLDQTIAPTSISIAGGVFGVGHVSCTNYDRPGWAYLSCNQDLAGLVGSGQLVAARTDGTGVQVFGFHHANAGGVYAASPHASASRDGSKVIFRSRWDGNIDTEIFAFVAGMAV